jgi:hypothetical protein
VPDATCRATFEFLSVGAVVDDSPRIVESLRCGETLVNNPLPTLGTTRLQSDQEVACEQSVNNLLPNTR